MPIRPSNQGFPHLSDIVAQDALPMVGTASREDAQTALTNIDSELTKLFQDRNFVLADGGTLVYTSGAPDTLTLTTTLKLHLNFGTPIVKTITGTSFDFDADGKMLYVVLDNRTSSSTLSGGNVVSNSATLPAVNSSNQEVVLIAKRVGSRLYLRNGQSLGNGDSTSLGAAAVVPSFADNLFEVFDNTTPTKKIKFEASGLTGTNTFTPPPATDTLAGLGTAQTFTAINTFSSRIKISDGTVSNPAISFNSDDDGTGTGIYRVVANSLGFAANGVNIGSYSSSGAWTLGAAGGVQAQTLNGRLLINYSADQYAAQIDQQGGAGDAGDGLQVHTKGVAASDTVLRLTSGGTVGSPTNTIGTTLATGAWTFGSSASGSPANHMFYNTSGGITIAATNTNGTAGLLLSAKGTGAPTITFQSDSTTNFELYTDSNNTHGYGSDAFIFNKLVGGTTAVGAIGTTGVWVLGPNAYTGIGHIFNGRLDIQSNTNSDTLKINATAVDKYPGIQFFTSHSNAAARNWQLDLNNGSHGTFNFRVSNAQGGNPESAGTTVGSISNTGTWTVGVAGAYNVMNGAISFPIANEAADGSIPVSSTVVRISTGTTTSSIANGSTDGQILIIVNDSTGTVIIDKTGSILTNGGGNISLAARGTAMLVWSSSIGRWLQIGTTATIS